MKAKTCFKPHRRDPAAQKWRFLFFLILLCGSGLLILSPHRARAAAGDLDLTFNPGLVSTNASPVRAFAVQSDGRILMGGDFTVVDGASRNHITRLNTDGSLDTTFNPGTGADATVNDIAIQPDGRILIGGGFFTINGTGRVRIARLNMDGSLDTSFNPGTGASNAVSALAIQPDGRILIGGSFSVYNGTTRNSIARLNADGSLDTTFNVGTGANNAVFAIAIQVDGRIVIGGQFTSFNGTARNRITGLNADGSLDATFNVGTGAGNAVNAFAVQPDGRILMGGVFTTYNGTTRNFIARLNTDGSLDTTFDPGTGTNSTVVALVIQTDGRIVIGGVFTTYNGTARNRIARVNADGSLDSAFNPGTGVPNQVQAVAAQTDGRILLGGFFALYNGTQRISVARANADGSLDTSFDAPTGSGGDANSVALQSDGRFVIGGDFGGVNGATRRGVGRINADGSIDSSFNPGTGADSSVFAIALQSDSRILIGGFFNTFNGTTRNRIARLNSDGSLDTTFNIGTGANSAVRAIAVQPDGRIVIGGQFTSYNGTARNNIARLNADGSLDTTFNVGTGANNTLHAIALQSDGGIVIGGAFTNYNGTARNRIARLNSDGSLDTIFNPGTGADSLVQAFAFQSDGRLLIGGSFTNYNGTARNRIARLNSDSSLDASFTSGTGASAPVFSLALQTDGRVVIAGQFATFNSLSRSAIARLNADGSLDTSFDPGTGAVTNIVNAVLVQPDGQIVIGGEFSTYDGVPRFGLARIQPGDVIIWNGSVSSDWNDPNNWSPAVVPTSSDTVFIPSGSLPNLPVVSSANAFANSLTTNAGQTLTINAGRSLTLTGLSNAGTIAGAGTLNLNGRSFSNNGIISVANVVVDGGGFKNLSGTGSFVNNLIAVNTGSTLDVVSDHQVNAVAATGSFRVFTSGLTLTVTGAGTPLTGNLTLNSTTNYNGAAPQTIATAMHGNLIVNNPAGVSLNSNVSVSGNLTLNGGNVTTGANTLTLSTSPSSVNRTSGHVIGNLAKFYNAPTNFTFPVGTNNGYSPVGINITSAGLGGTVMTVRAVETNQPTLPPSTSLSRYWALSSSNGTGVTANLTFNYLQPDVMGSEANYRIIRVNGSTAINFPHNPPNVVIDTANNTASINGVTEFSDWTLGEPSSATAIRFVEFTATACEDGTLLEWRTGFESDNLGFNVYRDEGGARKIVNQQLIAGSALRIGSGVTLESGASYTWWDKKIADCRNVTYWLEDVDLNGESTWQGPFVAQEAGGSKQEAVRKQHLAQTLGNLGKSQTDSSEHVEAAAAMPGIDSASLELQSPIALREAVKIAVRHEGWYRATQPELVQAGLDEKVNPKTLRLFVDGIEQTMLVTGESDGAFDATDSIEFYGTGLDTPSTDTRVYWLLAGDEPGSRIKIAKSDGKPGGARSFSYTVERKERIIYYSALLNGDAENFFGPVIAAQAVDQTLVLHSIDADAQPELEVAIQGVTDLPQFPDHHVRVMLNGAMVGRLVFDGRQHSAERFTISQASLIEGTNTVTFIPEGGPSDITLVDYVRLTYSHTYAAEEEFLKLVVPAGTKSQTIAGYNSPLIRVFDVTEPGSITEISGSIEKASSGYSITVDMAGPGARTLLALTPDRVQKASSITANSPSSLRSPNNGADLLIITRHELMESLARLATHRQSQGLSVSLVDIEDIYDEFSFGHKSPQAIKDFRSYASASWKKKPRYVLLGGDACFDSRNYLGFGETDLVPTRLIDTQYMEAASDDWFADLNSDGFAELAVGRLPARTAEEATLMVDKLIGYDRSQPSEEALLVADRNDGFNFEAASLAVEPLLPAYLRVNEIFRGRTDDATAKRLLIEAINRGQKMVNYAGHGSVDLWRGRLLTSSDARELTNEKHLPMFVMMTCLNGYFNDPALDSLAETLLKAERGGAVAVWASSALTLPIDQEVMNRELYRLLFTAGQPLRLGDATVRAKAVVSDGDVRRTWILFGDPTTVLKS